jgi:hypothetical protein
MTITYAENEKRHILESSTGYVSTYLKSQLSKEEAEQAFKLSLKMMPIEQEEVNNLVLEEPQKEYSEFIEVSEKPKKGNGKK